MDVKCCFFWLFNEDVVDMVWELMKEVRPL